MSRPPTYDELAEHLFDQQRKRADLARAFGLRCKLAHEREDALLAERDALKAERDKLAEDALTLLEEERLAEGVDEWDEADGRALLYCLAWKALGEERAQEVVRSVGGGGEA